MIRFSLVECKNDNLRGRLCQIIFNIAFQFINCTHEKDWNYYP